MVIRVNPVNALRRTRLQALLVPALFTVSAAAVAAGETSLPDPTRPPEGMSAVTASAPAEIAAFSEPRLQSVMIGTAGRSAIISGQRYQLGDRIGDARLVKISEAEVVLAGASGRRAMTLFPPVKTRVEAPKPAAARRAAGRNATPAAEPKSDLSNGLNAGLNAGPNSSRSP